MAYFLHNNKFYKAGDSSSCKMIKKIFFGFVLFLFVIQGVFAVSTDIKVKTIPFADVQVSILGESSVLDTLTKTSDGYGDVRFTFSIDDSSYSVIVFAKQNYQNIVEPEKFNDQKSGELLYVEMFPSGFTPIETPNSTKVEPVVVPQENTSIVENITQENETVVANDTEKTNDSLLTGFAVFEGGTFSIIAYIFGGIIFLGFLVFMIVKFSKRKVNNPKEVRVTKLSEIKQDKEIDLKERMDNAEKKLKEAKDELEAIKKQKAQGNLSHQAEIEEAKRKLIEDEKRLIELRKKSF